MERFYSKESQSKQFSISDQIYIKNKDIAIYKEGCYIMIKRSIKEDKTIVNIYAPNNGAP